MEGRRRSRRNADRSAKARQMVRGCFVSCDLVAGGGYETRITNCRLERG